MQPPPANYPVPTVPATATPELRVNRPPAAAPTTVQVSHHAPMPLYSQIRETLRARINEGIYQGDGRLPSENELVRLFGVSRITVRQALNDLQKEGVIFKVHG